MIINKPTIKINFTDFWSTFNPQDNYFTSILSPYFNLEISEQPDFLIYSVFGNAYEEFKGIRIFYTAENVRPDFRVCDFALSFDYKEHPRHLRLPLCSYVLSDTYYNPNALKLTGLRNLEEIIKGKTKFCSFLVNNPNAKERIEFFKELSKYKKVDSAGKVMYNMETPHKRVKLFPFLSPYKFNICFENTAFPGYTTEKIINAMLSNCIPIYWGDPLVHEVFNTKSFINVQDYATYQEAIEHIIEIDNDETLYRQYLTEPYIYESEEVFRKTSEVIAFFTNIFTLRESFQPIALHPFYPTLVKSEKKITKLLVKSKRKLMKIIK